MTALGHKRSLRTISHECPLIGTLRTPGMAETTVCNLPKLLFILKFVALVSSSDR